MNEKLYKKIEEVLKRNFPSIIITHWEGGEPSIIVKDFYDLILQEKKALLNTITAQINAMHDDVLKDDWVSQDNLGVALDEGTQLIYDETKKELEEEL